MSDSKREFYLIGFFKDMNSVDKSLTAFLFFLFMFLSVIAYFIYDYNKDFTDKMMTADSCSSKVLLLEQSSRETRHLLYACKGVVIKESCEDKLISYKTMRKVSTETIETILYACRANKEESAARYKKLKE